VKVLPHNPNATIPLEQGVAFNVHPIGVVHSPHRHAVQALPRMDRWAVEIFPRFSDVVEGLAVGTVAWLLTFHIEPDSKCESSGFDKLATHPLHQVSPIRFIQVKLIGRDGESLQVEGAGIEDGTPVLDIRPALCPLTRRSLN